MLEDYFAVESELVQAGVRFHVSIVDYKLPKDYQPGTEIMEGSPPGKISIARSGAKPVFPERILTGKISIMRSGAKSVFPERILPASLSGVTLEIERYGNYEEIGMLVDVEFDEKRIQLRTSSENKSMEADLEQLLGKIAKKLSYTFK